VTSTHAVEDEVARLLRARRAGDQAAETSLFSLLYDELRGMAARRFMSERPDHTLVPTSLVHEVYLRLDGTSLTCADKDEFLRLAATVMRRVLIDSARRRRVREPGTGEQPALESEPQEEEALLALDGALTRLEADDLELARLVNLRYLVGLSVNETANVLGVSTAKVVRDWRTARAYLQREISRDG
jgi:RNA polymerase sigma factor (TIGR02999 family)